MTTENANMHPSPVPPVRPNFFIVLGLSPDEPWDEEKFRALLREKRNEWSRLQASVGQRALMAQKNLKLIQDIEAIMVNPELRKAEASAARAQLAAGRQAKAAEFEKQLAFINAKDSLDETELEKFINDFQDIYPADKIKERITVKKSASPAAHDAGNQQMLEATIARDIADRLNMLNKASLYDLLGLPDATGTQQLCRAAEELYKSEVQRMPKTAEVTARAELAGHAKVIFASEEKRKQYDESLRRESLNRLLTNLDAIMNRVTNKELQAGQVNVFLENAQQAGWEREEAHSLLMERARLRKWFLAPLIVEAKIRCRKCNHLNSQTRKLCSECGMELYFDCPNCGQQVSSEDRICDNCGFEVGNRYMVDQRLSDLKTLLDTRKFEDAQDSLRTIESIWRPKNPDNLSRRINEYKSQLEQIKQQTYQSRKANEDRFLSLMSEKRLLAAQDFLSRNKADISGAEAHQRTINESLNRAELKRRSLQQSRHNLNPDDHIARYLEIESICKDLPGLENLRIPPSPPAHLQAKVQGSRVSLAWRPSTTPNVFYILVRKSHTPPTTPMDRIVVSDNISGCAYEDDAVLEAGLPLYYAVYSGYSEVRSTSAAVLARPVMATRSVLSVRAQVGDQQVDLDWKTPPHCYSVIVVRKEQTAPASITDGVRVGEYPVPEKHLTDHNVRNGQTYHYALYCQFKDLEGKTVPSSAEYISATPDQPPQPIYHLDITGKRSGNEYEVEISWQRPKKGDVVIMKTDKAFDLSAGEEIPEKDLYLHGERLPQRPDSITDRWTKAGVAHYTPVILYQNMAYIGASQRFVCVDTITNLEIKNLGDKLQFSWTWPENCQEVQIAYDLEGYPRLDDLNGNVERVSRARYEQQGYFYLPGTADQEYYMIITAIITLEGTKIAAEGILRQTRQVTLLELRYEIRQPDLFHRKRALHITMNRPGRLPEMRLIGKRDRLPFTKSDGELIKSIDSILLTGKKYTVNLPERAYQEGTYVKLFLEDDSMYDSVSIINPEIVKLRLS
jgi:hypothetical protein